MTRRYVLPTLATLYVVAVLAAPGCERTPVTQSSEQGRSAIPMRFGWQTTVAIQGQQVQALKRTSFLRDNGLAVTFEPFPYGPPLVEAAVTKNLDVVNLGTVPMLTLLSRSDNWVIVSRTGNVRFALVVPPSSTITKVEDLKGNQVAVSLGSSAELFLMRELERAGLQSTDVIARNVAPEGQGEVARSGSGPTWGEFAALATWDPTLTLLENENRIRILASGVDYVWTAISRQFIQAHPDAAAAFLRASLQAWPYFAAHQAEMSDAYREDAKLKIDTAILNKIAAFDHNASAGKVAEVDIAVDDQRKQELERAMQFLLRKGTLKREIAIDAAIDLKPLEQARHVLLQDG
jgi:ABC-type nitrate/sulfonate/bicarbonate transport system substrate-binding protein